MFFSILDGTSSELIQLAARLFEGHNELATLLCLDFTFSFYLDESIMSLESAAISLSSFLRYTDLLRAHISSPDPCDNPHTLQLLGLTGISEEEFLIPPNSILLPPGTLGSWPPILRTVDEGYVVARLEVNKLISRVLELRLQERIQQENHVSRDAAAFRPCSSSIIHGRCFGGRFCRQSHDFRCDSEGYSQVIRLHLQQISIFDAIGPFGTINPREQAKQQR